MKATLKEGTYTPRKTVKESSQDPEHSVSVFDMNRVNPSGDPYCVASHILAEQADHAWEQYMADIPAESEGMVVLYRANRIDQKVHIHVKDLADGFCGSAFVQESFLNYYRLERLVRMFITEPERGLNSSFEEDDYPAIHEAVKQELDRRDLWAD